MNVIVANKHENELKSLGVDVIKIIKGNCEAFQLGTMLQNFFFQYLILDITAINNYKEINNMQTLTRMIDPNKMIVLIEDNSDKNLLFQVGINKVTTNINEIASMIQRPNLNNQINVDNNQEYSIGKTYNVGGAYNQMVVTTTDFSMPKPQVQKVENPNIVKPLEAKEVVEKPKLENTVGPITSDIVDNTDEVKVIKPKGRKDGKRIIGIQNVTREAGATTLIYMLKKQFEKNYKTCAFEINRRDFACFKQNNMVSVLESQLEEMVKKYNCEINLVDINDSKIMSLCDEIIYLIEPSMIKLNKMMITNPEILSELKEEKIILNKSLLGNDMVNTFQKETGLKVLYTIPPLNEREDNSQILTDLISKVFL